jgi:hypothetical protein
MFVVPDYSYALVHNPLEDFTRNPRLGFQEILNYRKCPGQFTKSTPT